MQITVLGIILVPLSLFWAARPVRLLQLAFVAAIFEAGAALVIGSGFGLPTAMVPGLLFIAYVVAQYALGMRYPAEGPVLRALTPLFALLGYAAPSAMLLPDAFAGLMVWPQRPDPLQFGFIPLAFNAGNVTQLLYLAMNIGMTTAAALFLTRAAIPCRSIVRAYLLGGYLVVGLAFWQFAARTAGVPFPSDVLYSNPGWVIVEQTLSGVPRIQGPFAEPAGLAFYLSGLCFCCLWLTMHGYRVMQVNVLLALAVLTMLLSTSTTGILTLLVGFPLVLLFAASRTRTGALARAANTAATLMLAGLVALGPVFVLKPGLLEAVSRVMASTVTKTDSESFDQRTEIDVAALDTVVPTYGLGVGWGSFRASSLLPGLLANAGVFGVAMLLWLIARVIRLAARAGPAARGHPGQILVDAFSAALCGQLAAALLSAPTIGSLAFFLQLGCMIGAVARISAERPMAGPAGVARRGGGGAPSRIISDARHAT